MKSNFNKSIFMLLLLLMSVQAKAVICLTPMAGSYTIDHSIVTGGTNFQTFTEAVAALTTCGVSTAVTITVAPGTYYEQVIIGAIPGASAANTITFDGVDRETRIITFNQLPISRYTIRLNGAKNVTIKNMTIDGGLTPIRWAMHITGGSEHIVLEGNKFHSGFLPYSGNSFTGLSTNNAGIIVSASPTLFFSPGINVNYLTITNNIISGGAVGVSIAGKIDALAEGIIINNNIFQDLTNILLNIGFANAPQISNNTFTGAIETQYANSPGAIAVANSTGGVLIANNKIQNIGKFGIRLSNVITSYTDPSNIYNNTVANYVTTAGSNIGAIAIDKSSFVNVWHNSVDVNIGFNKPLLITALSTYVDIRNNTFSQRVGSIGYTTAAIDIQDLTSISYLDHNNYYSTTPNIAQIEGVMIATFADLKSLMATHSFDQNSISKDPQFYNYTDLIPYGPNLYMAGTPITYITHDLAGNIRNGVAPSIGAYEVMAKANDVGVSELISPADKAIGGEAHEIKLRVINYGTNVQSDIPVTVSFSGDINGSVLGIVTGSAAWGESFEAVIGTYNLSTGGKFIATAATALPGDEDNSNDAREEEIYLHALITPPQVNDIVVCEGTTGTILATGNDKYNWYEEQSGSIISTINPFITPVLNISNDYYVEGMNETDAVLPNTTWSITSCGAQIYEIAAGEGHDITLTALDINYNFYSLSNPASNQVKITLLPKSYSELTEADYLSSTPLLVLNPLQSEVSNNPAISPLINVPLPNIHIPAGGAITLVMEGNYRVLQQSTPIEDNFITVRPLEGYCSQNTLAHMRGNFYYTATSIPSEKVAIQAIVPTVDAGDNHVVYLGYAPMECATITATGAYVDDPLSSITWSNGTTGVSINVCPTETTTYTVTVTDQYGCTYSDDITVCVVDVRCQNGKVSMCKNPGSSGNWVNICVAPSAVEGQLQSGAVLGVCGTQTDCDNVALKRSVATAEERDLELDVYPNPTSGMVNIEVNVDMDEALDIQLFNITGQLQKVIYSGSISGEAVKTISFDAGELAQGTYLVRVSTANSVKQTKLFIAK